MYPNLISSGWIVIIHPPVGMGRRYNAPDFTGPFLVPFGNLAYISPVQNEAIISYCYSKGAPLKIASPRRIRNQRWYNHSIWYYMYIPYWSSIAACLFQQVWDHDPKFAGVKSAMPLFHNAAKLVDAMPRLQCERWNQTLFACFLKKTFNCTNRCKKWSQIYQISN